MIDIEICQTKVLAGVLGKSNRERFPGRIDIMVKDVGESYFSGKYLALYKVVVNYYTLTYGCITHDEFITALRSANIGEDLVFEYVQLFDKVEQSEVLPEAQFKFAVAVLKEQTKTFKLTRALVDAAEIMTVGKQKGKNKLAGYNAAKTHLEEVMADIEAAGQTVAMDGDVLEERRDILHEYSLAKHHKADRMFCGIRDVDNATKGFTRGDLILLAGFTGDGKSMTCVNVAEHLVFSHKQNVVYMTGETLRIQVRRRFISRRSRDPRYGYPDGLPYSAIKEGALTPEQEDVFQMVLADMESTAYGRFQLCQFPRNMTVDGLVVALARYESVFPVDLFIVDELRLLRSTKKRQAKWEELDDIILALKQLGVTHNNGRGVPIISPYQVRRDDWKRAVEEHRPYNKTCLSGSSEAEKSADIVWSVLRLPESCGGRPNELQCSILKNRDGEEVSEFFLRTDFRSCYVTSRQEVSVDI